MVTKRRLQDALAVAAACLAVSLSGWLLTVSVVLRSHSAPPIEQVHLGMTIEETYQTLGLPDSWFYSMLNLELQYGRWTIRYQLVDNRKWIVVAVEAAAIN